MDSKETPNPDATKGTDDFRSEIEKLEAEKSKLLERVKVVNRKIRYKDVELQALEPAVKQYQSVNIGPVRRQLNAVEFKISTQSLTSKMERELVKQAQELRKKYNEIMKIERVKNRRDLIQKDLLELNAERNKIDEELKVLREKIKTIREGLKRRSPRREGEGRREGRGEGREHREGERRGREESSWEGAKAQPKEEMYFTLEDIVEIKKKDKSDKSEKSEKSDKSEQS